MIDGCMTNFTFFKNDKKQNQKQLTHSKQLQLLLMYSQALEIKKSRKYGNLVFINN